MEYTSLEKLLNNAPYFQSAPQGKKFTLLPSQTNFEYELPKYFDQNGDKMKVEVSKIPKGSFYENGKIYFRNITLASTYMIEIKVIDQKMMSSKQYWTKIVF